jgi:hypothetical protein
MLNPINPSNHNPQHQGKAAPAVKSQDHHHHQQEQKQAPELLFAGAVLLDKEGNKVEDPVKALEGRAVGLLFGAMWWCVYT